MGIWDALFGGNTTSYQRGVARGFGPTVVGRGNERASTSRRGGSGSFPNTARNQLGSMQYGAQPFNRSTSQSGLGQSGPSSPMDALLEQLLSILSTPIGQVDQSDLMAQISGQINPVFDARRGAIEDLMSRAEQRVGAGRKDIEGMYGALSKDYTQMLPEVEAGNERATAQTEELFGQLKSNIEGNYARIQQEQADLFAQLGIQEAAPAVLDDQATQQLQSMNAAESSRAANVQRSEEIGQIDEDYWRQGAPLATLEGSNRSSDLLSGLMDYLAEQSGAINELEAMRQSELTGSFNQLMGSANESAQSQQRWQQEQLIKLLMSERDRQFEGKEGGGNEVLNFIGSTGLPQGSQQELYQAFNAIQGNEDVVAGRQNDPGAALPNTRTSITPERIKQIARALATEQRMNPAETEALLRLIDVMYG